MLGRCCVVSSSARARPLIAAVVMAACGNRAGAPDASGSVDATAALPVCASGVVAAFERTAIDPPAAYSEGYQPLDQVARNALGASMRARFAADGATALQRASEAGYELCEGEGSEAGIALWRPASAGLGRAVIAWRAESARPLIIGTPHSFYDIGTLEQGVVLFQELSARALVASGTRRCANTAASPCEGTTSVCTGIPAAYRESDMAHVVDTAFQAAHEALVERFPTDWVVSVHGMGASGVSLSNGTTSPSAEDAAVAALGIALMAELPDEQITSCNEWPGAVVEQRLCGTTNMQGRLVNGSADPCAAAGSAPGRFVHMEQSTAVRAATDEVIAAFLSALP